VVEKINELVSQIFFIAGRGMQKFSTVTKRPLHSGSQSRQKEDFRIVLQIMSDESDSRRTLFFG
jgi:hypothetical protein